jgi:hypothetical protein
MDFASAVKATNNLLRTIQPRTFHSSWIRKHSPQVYLFIRNNIRTEIGGIEWDTFTRALDRKLQRRGKASRRGRRAKCVKESKAVEAILRRYQEKLYTFLSPLDANDEQTRDIISISPVRMAQWGNAAAKQEIIRLVRLTIDAWIEQCPRLSCWEGRDDMIQERIEGCIRCYRYSGTFIGYLFKTLEYAGRGLRPVVAYSLDDHLYSRKIRWIGRDAHVV